MNRQSKGQGSKKKRKKSNDNEDNTQKTANTFFGELELKKKHKGVKMLFGTSIYVGAVPDAAQGMLFVHQAIDVAQNPLNLVC